MTKMNKLSSGIKLFIVNYLLVPSMGIIFCLLEAFGRIKFRHFERFPIWEGKLIMVSNHPSLLEPVLLPLMGFPWMNFPWLFTPVWTKMKFSLKWFKELKAEFSINKKLIPTNLPDKNNFYDPLYMGLVRGVSIPVNRNGQAHGRIRAIFAIKRTLDKGGRVLIFPEGARTFNAIKRSGAVSENGQQLAKLKEGAGWLALKTNAKILPIWVEGTDKVLPNNKFPFPRLWHRVTINVGSPFLIQGHTREEATSEITQALLQTAVER